MVFVTWKYEQYKETLWQQLAYSNKKTHNESFKAEINVGC